MASYGSWVSFEATHIFPLAYEEHWNELGSLALVSNYDLVGGQGPESDRKRVVFLVTVQSIPETCDFLVQIVI